MKSLFGVLMAVSLLLMPLAVSAQSEQNSRETPPISQPLIREGDFALKLVDALKIGTAQNEAEAETMLTSSGIAPRNGWIADYPVTPDIIGELQNGIAEAADSGRLALNRDEATKILQNLTGELGLPIVADTSGKYAGTEPPRGYGEYSDPSVITNYYYSEGPPVVTYYPPPWDYDYMYAWVPSPFWCSGFFFPGFFVLHDFHRVILVGHHRFVVSNHVFDHKTKRVFAIDPVRRHFGKIAKADMDRSYGRGFNSAEARRGASAIFERSRERTGFTNGRTATTERGLAGRNTSAGGRGGDQGRRSATERGMIRDRVGTGSGNMSGRAISRSNSSTGGRAEMSFQRPSPGMGRSFSASSGAIERSLSSPMRSNGRSFNQSSTGGRGSFGGFHGGSTGGFRGGGFSGGGCRGRC